MTEQAPTTTRVRREAREIVGSPWYRESWPDRIAYARDCWPLGILWARGGQFHRHSPDFIVVPESVDEVLALVNLAAATQTPVVPYGAGSGVCGGTLNVQGGFTVDMKRFDRVCTIDRERLLLRAGAGAIGMHLETDLNRRGFTLGHYPSSLYCSTLGGYLAGRSAGQLSSRFGKIEDMCVSMEVVTGAGEVVETADWTPDLTQSIIGSEGTLGLITEATLRIEPVAESRVYRGFHFHTVEAALDRIRLVMQAGFRPAVVRLYDEFDSLMAARAGGHGKHDEDDEDSPESGVVRQLANLAIDRAKRPARNVMRRVAKSLLRRGLGAPVLLNRAVDMLPASCLLILGFDGPTGLTEMEAEAAFAIARESGEDLGEEPGKHWFENRFNVSYKLSPMFDVGAYADTMEVSTTWDNVLNLYHTVRRRMSRDAFVMAHFSHAYPEGCSIYFTFAGFAEDGEPIEALYQRTWATAVRAVRETGASVAHHHGIGLWKAPYLTHEHAGGSALNAVLKARFDPKGILNPGKLWDVAQR